MTGLVVLYIAGPMTGLPEFNLPAFDAAESALRAVGYGVQNPARHGVSPDKTWEDYMRRDLADVLTVDGIALLDGWWNSRGASLEVHVAKALSVPIAPLADWLARTVSVPA